MTKRIFKFEVNPQAGGSYVAHMEGFDVLGKPVSGDSKHWHPGSGVKLQVEIPIPDRMVTISYIEFGNIAMPFKPPVPITLQQRGEKGRYRKK